MGLVTLYLDFLEGGEVVEGLIFDKEYFSKSKSVPRSLFFLIDEIGG